MHIVITFPVVPPLMSSMLREEHSSAKIRTPMDESGMDGMTEERETKLGLVLYRFGLMSCDDPSNKRDKLITVAKAQEEINADLCGISPLMLAQNGRTDV